MYIGDIGVKGLHHLVYEVVDNSIDEAMAGYATHIEVYINEDNSIKVVDNGRGIPVDMHEKEHKSALEVVLTVLHAGGKFDKGSYKVSGGLHGVGVSCVNALSTYLRAEIRRDGKVYMQEFAYGKPLHGVEVIGETNETGTTIIFHPDPLYLHDDRLRLRYSGPSVARPGLPECRHHARAHRPSGEERERRAPQRRLLLERRSDGVCPLH